MPVLRHEATAMTRGVRAHCAEPLPAQALSVVRSPEAQHVLKEQQALGPGDVEDDFLAHRAVLHYLESRGASQPLVLYSFHQNAPACLAKARHYLDEQAASPQAAHPDLSAHDQDAQDGRPSPSLPECEPAPEQPRFLPERAAQGQ